MALIQSFLDFWLARTDTGGAMASGDEILVRRGSTFVRTEGAPVPTGSVTLSHMADLAQSTVIGRAASAGTGAPTALTAAQATAIMNAFTGDSGAGGVKGLVPAPAAGDAAAVKVLCADGTWVEQSGGGVEAYTPNAANTGPVAATIDGVTAPIRKRLKSRYGINTTRFDGATWISRAADLTGIADGKEGLLHFVVDFRGNDATATTIIANGNGRFKVFKGTDNKIRFLGYNAAGSLILDMRTNTAYTSANNAITVTASWDLATGTTHIYVNGVSDKQASPTATNDTIDYTATRWDIAADNNTQHLNGDLAHVLFDDGYIDLSNSRELRRFQTGNGLCAYMPGGRVYDSPSTQPLLFLTGNSINFKHNHGSAGNATAFTVPHGTLANGSGVNGSLYKDLAANDLQNNSPVALMWDNSEDVWVAPIALKRTVTKTNYGATATTETMTLPMNVVELVIYGQGPGGGGGGGSTSFGGGGAAPAPAASSSSTGSRSSAASPSPSSRARARQAARAMAPATAPWARPHPSPPLTSPTRSAACRSSSARGKAAQAARRRPGVAGAEATSPRRPSTRAAPTTGPMASASRSSTSAPASAKQALARQAVKARAKATAAAVAVAATTLRPARLRRAATSTSSTSSRSNQGIRRIRMETASAQHPVPAAAKTRRVRCAGRPGRSPRTVTADTAKHNSPPKIRYPTGMTLLRLHFPR